MLKSLKSCRYNGYDITPTSIYIQIVQIRPFLQVFGNVCTVVSACRERVRGVRARLVGCKQLLRWRRNDLRRLCGETAQHRHALILLNQMLV